MIVCDTTATAAAVFTTNQVFAAPVNDKLSKHQARLEQGKRTLYYAALARSKQGKKEAADELAVPVGTVKSRLHSAVKRLGKAWEDSQATPNN